MDIHFSEASAGSLSPNIASLMTEVLPKLEVMKEEPDQELYNFHKNANKTLELSQETFDLLCDKLEPGLGKKVRDEGLDYLNEIISKFPGGKVPKPPLLMAPPAHNPMLRMAPPELLQQAPPDVQRMMMRLPAAEMMKILSGGRAGMLGGPRPGPPGPPGPPLRGSPPVEAMLPPPLLLALEEVTRCDVKTGELADKWEERQSGVRLLQTLCKLLAGLLLRNWYTIKPQLFHLLEMLALNESSELEPDLAQDCTLALACLATCILPGPLLSTALDNIEKVASSTSSWKAKNAILEFLQIIVFWNFASFKSDPSAEKRIVAVVLSLIKDERVEVREKASKVLGGIIHCCFISEESSSQLLSQFKTEVGKKLRKKPRAEEDLAEFQSSQSAALVRRHSAVLGLSAFVHSCPYDIPPHLPDILMILAGHLHDPQPISATIKNVFQDFKRTHQDNWAEHKQKLTEDQLSVLTDLLVSPSYYA